MISKTTCPQSEGTREYFRLDHRAVAQSAFVKQMLYTGNGVNPVGRTATCVRVRPRAQSHSTGVQPRRHTYTLERMLARSRADSNACPYGGVRKRTPTRVRPTRVYVRGRRRMRPHTCRHTAECTHVGVRVYRAYVRECACVRWCTYACLREHIPPLVDTPNHIQPRARMSSKTRRRTYT